MPNLTDAQRLRDFALETGVPKSALQLRPHERVIGVTASDTTAIVTVQCYQLVETSRELRFRKQGLYMLVWQRSSATEPWAFQPDFMRKIWNPDFKPVTIVKYGRVMTPREAQARREWDLLCWRPGTDSQPLDGYSRVLEGPTHPKMEGYW